jgi:hypothetical protein
MSLLTCFFKSFSKCQKKIKRKGRSSTKITKKLVLLTQNFRVYLGFCLHIIKCTIKTLTYKKYDQILVKNKLPHGHKTVEYHFCTQITSKQKIINTVL